MSGGVFIYHPLHSQTPLHELYHQSAMGARTLTHDLSEEDRTRLTGRYRMHMREVLARRSVSGAQEAAEIGDDERALVKRFRAFFPALIEKTSLTDKAGRVAVFFPKLQCFDNRCIEIKGHNEAIFVTARTLDVIELFAHTLSMAVRLNGLELAAMLGLEDPPPPHVQLPWMTMCPPAS
jgi:hypothetical protein